MRICTFPEVRRRASCSPPRPRWFLRSLRTNPWLWRSSSVLPADEPRAKARSVPLAENRWPARRNAFDLLPHWCLQPTCGLVRAGKCRTLYKTTFPSGYFETYTWNAPVLGHETDAGLAAAVLRFQCVERAQEAALYASEPCETWVGKFTGGVALEQFSNTEGAGPAFRFESLARVPRPCPSCFWRDRAGIFIRHWAAPPMRVLISAGRDNARGPPGFAVFETWESTTPPS